MPTPKPSQDMCREKDFLASAIEKARGALSHAEYSVLRKALEDNQAETTDTGGVLFVTTTPIEGDANDAFEKAYLPHFEIAHTVSIAKTFDAEAIAERASLVADAVKTVQPVKVYALGSKAQAALEKAGIECTYLPHPAAYLTDPARTTRKILDTIKSNTVQSAPKAGDSVCIAIAKADTAKQVVYSVVSDPYEFDLQGDHLPAHEIESAAHRWLKESRVIGDRHAKFEGVDAHVVESYVAQYPTSEDYQKAMVGDAHCAYKIPFGKSTVHSGSWVIGIKLGDELWKEHLAGELDAVSIGAFGTKEATTHETLPKVTFVDLAAPSE